MPMPGFRNGSPKNFSDFGGVVEYRCSGNLKKAIANCLKYNQNT